MRCLCHQKQFLLLLLVLSSIELESGLTSSIRLVDHSVCSLSSVASSVFCWSEARLGYIQFQEDDPPLQNWTFHLSSTSSASYYPNKYLLYGLAIIPLISSFVAGTDNWQFPLRSLLQPHSPGTALPKPTFARARDHGQNRTQDRTLFSPLGWPGFYCPRNFSQCSRDTYYSLRAHYGCRGGCKFFQRSRQTSAQKGPSGLFCMPESPPHMRYVYRADFSFLDFPVENFSLLPFFLRFLLFFCSRRTGR